MALNAFRRRPVAMVDLFAVILCIIRGIIHLIVSPVINTAALASDYDRRLAAASAGRR